MTSKQTYNLLLVFLFLVQLVESSLPFNALHTAVLGGPLHLIDNSFRAAQVGTPDGGVHHHLCTTPPPPTHHQATIYYKAIPTTTHSLYHMRAVMFLTDPLHEYHAVYRIDNNTTMLYENYFGPNWQQYLLAPPSLRLQPLKHHNHAEHGNISLHRVIPYVPSDISHLLNATTQRYSYQRGMLEGHGPLQYELATLNASVMTSHYGGQWALCVEDWWQCARVPAAVLLEGDTVRGGSETAYWLVFKPLFAGVCISGCVVAYCL